MNTVTHKIYPVSYIDNEGKQTNAIYTFDPSRVDESYWVGDVIELECVHPNMGPAAKAEKIAELKRNLAALEADDEA